MNKNKGSQIVFAALASMATVLLPFCPAGAAVDDPPVYKPEMETELLSAFAALKGQAKFVDIARLFGWKVLNDFWASWAADRQAGRPWSNHGTDIDKLSLRLSQKAGVDLTPLLHFWGTPPRDAATLKAAAVAEKLSPSAKVHDTLMRYKSLVPANNQAFRDFAAKWWGRQPSAKGYWTEREHTKQWEGFNEETSARIKQAVQEVIDEYFQDGRPEGG